MRRRALAVAVAIALALGLTVLLAPGAAAGGRATLLSASLSGAKEVPGPGDPDGSGRAFVRLSGDQACFLLDWSRIGAPTRAHIHIGPRGVAGGIVLGFFEAPTEYGIPCGTHFKSVAFDVKTGTAVIVDAAWIKAHFSASASEEEMIRVAMTSFAHRDLAGAESLVDLDELISVAGWLEDVLERQLEGQVYRAGTFAPVAG